MYAQMGKVMHKYTYILRNYHAIKESEIKLDGITVLSGINGCGKSTLSRWLYYLINGAKSFDNLLFEIYKEKIRNLVKRMQMACMDLYRFRRSGNDNLKGYLEKIDESDDILSNIKINSKDQIALSQELFLQALNATSQFLTDMLTGDIPETRKNRILNYMDIHIENADIHQAVASFTEQNKRMVNKLTVDLYHDIEDRPTKIFYEALKQHFNISENQPLCIQIKEDDVNIIENDHVANIFGIQRAIYIDTPMAIAENSTENIFWSALREMMISDKSDRILSFEEKKFLMRIRELLGGETVLRESTYWDTKDLRYISNDRKIDIFLKDAATGFKTFSYLQRLLENGYLNDETLLMIDEPEAHLHPQWIVEFARLLVLFNKKLGLRIMLASHNPDMVAAIHDIANKEGILENTNFYVAETASQDSHQYVYKDLKHEIGEIFESFNIAIENISRYGRVDL